MTEPLPLTLAGCTPLPLASYLKALGVLRLVCEQGADPDARGWWSGECFHLSTRLDRDALRRFFLEDYRPSPIVAPWNGGSGFYPGDNRDGYAPLLESAAPRFQPIRGVMSACAEAVTAAGLTSRPEPGDGKRDFVGHLRATLPDEALPWIDAALALTTDGLTFPPLLGTGGNDGRLDFTNNLMKRLVSDRTPEGLFDAADGRPRPGAGSLLDGALFGDPTDGLSDAAVGQFAPGAAGGPNAGSGFQGPSKVNSWDFVLMIEGAVAFAGAATRRYDTSRSGSASFPFMVRNTGAGWGGIDPADEADARAEFWAPLWDRPAGAAEIGGLLSEGRAVLNGRTARDGLDFARAVAGLGVSRDIRSFQRFGFVMRAGKAYLATPLGRLNVAETQRRDLIADLDQGGWLDRVRQHLRRDDDPARSRHSVRRLDEALFALTGAEEKSSDAIQRTLVEIGRITRHLSLNPKLRDEIPPPPPLAREWVEGGDDDSPEYRVAAALAGLGARPPEPAASTKSDDPAPAPERGGGAGLPMAAHLAPLDQDRIESPYRSWSLERSPLAVWGDGDLARNLCVVLDRRMVAAGQGLLAEDRRFAGAAPARLTDVIAFLEGPFHDARCAALLAGLVWAKPSPLPARDAPPDRTGLPLAYAALKPLFTPAARLAQPLWIGARRIVPLPKGGLGLPAELVGRLTAGHVDEVVAAALLRARAAGLATPFAASRPGSAEARQNAARGRRLAAALLIPLNDAGLARVIARAYPAAAEDPEKETSRDA